MGEWELVEDGYHREWRFVETGTGKILGGVRGNAHDSKGEWRASLRGQDRPYLGDFVTEDLAKNAVVRALAPKGKGR